MSIKIESNNDDTVITVSGALTINTVTDYIQKISPELHLSSPLKFNLSSVDEIDSCGLQLLLALDKQVKSNGFTSEIVRTNKSIESAFKTCRLNHQAL